MTEFGPVHEWVCSFCGKTFGFKQNWKRHIVVHTKERNYLCQFCSQAFKFPSNKTRHEANCKQTNPQYQIKMKFHFLKYFRLRSSISMEFKCGVAQFATRQLLTKVTCLGTPSPTLGRSLFLADFVTLHSVFLVTDSDMRKNVN